MLDGSGILVCFGDLRKGGFLELTGQLTAVPPVNR